MKGGMGGDDYREIPKQAKRPACFQGEKKLVALRAGNVTLDAQKIRNPI